METLTAIVIGFFLAASVLHIYGYVTRTMYDGIEASRTREKLYRIIENFNLDIQKTQTIIIDAEGRKAEITFDSSGEQIVYMFDEDSLYRGSEKMLDGVSGQITNSNGLVCLSLRFNGGKSLDLYKIKGLGG